KSPVNIDLRLCFGSLLLSRPKRGQQNYRCETQDQERCRPCNRPRRPRRRPVPFLSEVDYRLCKRRRHGNRFRRREGETPIDPHQKRRPYCRRCLSCRRQHFIETARTGTYRTQAIQIPIDIELQVTVGKLLIPNIDTVPANFCCSSCLCDCEELRTRAECP